MISTPQLPEEDLVALQKTLSPALADFRLWQGNVENGREWEPPLPVITHVLQRWYIPRGADLEGNPLSQVLESNNRWHVQICLESPPEDKTKSDRYYARVRLRKGRWDCEWFGYKWYQPVAGGIEWLSQNEQELDGEVRLVSSSLYKFTSFWLVNSQQHLVVSTTVAGLQEFEPLPQEKLKARLLTEFGLGHGSRGIQRSVRQDPSAADGDYEEGA